jgi:hypothetical protein
MYYKWIQPARVRIRRAQAYSSGGQFLGQVPNNDRRNFDATQLLRSRFRAPALADSSCQKSGWIYPLPAVVGWQSLSASHNLMSDCRGSANAAIPPSTLKEIYRSFLEDVAIEEVDVAGQGGIVERRLVGGSSAAADERARPLCAVIRELLA